MIKIPFETSQIKKQPKLQTKNKNKFILSDKIVNKNIEPTLFNVQNAAISMKAMSNPAASRPIVGTIETDLPQISIATLIQMNVGLSNLKEDFSLIEDNNPQIDLSNPNIISNVELTNLTNEPIKPSGFELANDPFYELDDNRLPGANSNDSQNAKDFIPSIDSSQILESLHVFNQSENYFGKNKYYK
jgi:hypothetical protein